MSADLLRIYLENLRGASLIRLVAVAVFIYLKVVFCLSSSAPAISPLFLFYPLLILIGSGALLYEGRLCPDLLMDPAPNPAKSALLLARSKLVYMTCWLVFLFYWPDGGFYEHIPGYLFIFCAIAVYAVTSTVFYPLFLWNIGLQGTALALMSWLDRDAPYTFYVTGGIAVFAACAALAGWRTAKAAVQMTESRRAAERNAKLVAQAEKSKTDFLAVIAHEIRTPMMGVLGMIDFLSETKVDAEQEACLNTIKQCSRTLLNTLNDLLDISREESRSLTVVKVAFDLPSTIENTVRSMRYLAKQKKLGLFTEIAPDLPRVILGDPHRLQQVVFNLLSNAVKFTKKGRVDLVAMKKESRVLIEVRDTGIGIPPEKIKTLFRKFSQAGHDISQEYGGSGLGLSITRNLVEMMGGQIGIRSRPGKGSVFWVEIPAVPQAQEAAPRAPVHDLPPLDILLVEDNQINQMITARYLAKRNHEVTLAYNGDHALALLRERVFDLILMDTFLPGKSGIETAALIKGMDTSRAAIPIIALTANGTQQHLEKCRAAGMCDRVIKPYVSEELFKIIARHVPAAPAPLPPDTAAPNRKLAQLEGEFGADYMRQVVDNSLKELDALMERLRLVQENGAAPDRLYPIVHDIKSVSGYIGLEAASSFAARIEEGRDDPGAPERIGSDIDALFGRVRGEMEELRAAMK